MFIVPAAHSPDKIAALIRRYLPKSRFTLNFDRQRVSRRVSGKPWAESFACRLLQVRLRTRKPYCGQHAGPCPINPIFGPKPHKLSTCLEGSDWVGFDDMVNDVLDRHSVEAVVWSKGADFHTKFFIRRGRERRTNYPADWVGTAMRWACDNDRAYWSSAHFGVKSDAPRSTFPDGTPGIPEWRAVKARKQERLLLASHHD
jgi:hypothetical protein